MALNHLLVPFIVIITRTSADDTTLCKTTTLGKEYVGTKAVTKNGYVCQRWDSQSPHAHGNDDAVYFPETTLADAQNYCRNPDNEPEGPWCYTVNTGERWNYCDVPRCADLACVTGPGVVNNAVFTPPTGPWPLGSDVTYTCSPGYVLRSGDLIRTCLSISNWSGDSAKCEELDREIFSWTPTAPAPISNPLTSRLVRYLQECLIWCQNTLDCRGASYDRATGECQLYNGNFAPVWGLNTFKSTS